MLNNPTCNKTIYNVGSRHLQECPLLRLARKEISHCSLQTDLSILDKEVADGVILPDVIRPESQTMQLVENSSCGVATIGEVLTGAQLILYRGAAVVLAFAVLVAGILIRVFTDRG